MKRGRPGGWRRQLRQGPEPLSPLMGRREVMRWLRYGCKNAHPTSAAAQASVFPGARQAPNGVTGGFHEHGLMAPCIGLLVSCPSKRWAKIVTPPGWPWSKPTKHRARNAEVSAESRLSTAMPRHREVPEHAGPMGPGVPRALRYEGHRRDRLRRPRVAKNRGAFARLRVS